MKRHQSIRASAALLALGGLTWSIKAGVIMATGSQPPLAYELGQLLFPFASLALYLTIPNPASPQKGGLVLAGLAFSGSILALAYPLLPGSAIPTAEEFLFPYSLFVLVGGVGGFLGLVLVAAGFYRARPDLGRLRSIPIIAALVPLPFLLTSAVHFEMPIFLVGLSWMALAKFAWSLARLLPPQEIVTSDL